MWQIDKTTKKCQTCTKLLGVNEDYFSALFYLASVPLSLSTGSREGQDKPVETGAANKKTETTITGHLQCKQADAEVQHLGRQDFCSNCWEKRTASGEESPFSFWQTKYTKAPEPPKTPRQVLLSFYDNLFEQAQNQDEVTESNASPNVSTNVDNPSGLRVNELINKELDKLIDTPQVKLKQQAKYLFSLILLRKKILKLKGTTQRDNIRYMSLERTADGKTYDVAEVSISEQELNQLRIEFSNLFEFRI